MTTAFEKKSKTYMAVFTGWLEKNGDDKGFLVGNTVGIIDTTWRKKIKILPTLDPIV